MAWPELDTAAVARALSQIADQPEDLVDAFFERREEVELPPEDDSPGVRVWREEGFAVRLLRRRHTWLASRDGIAERQFADALRQVARASPAIGLPEPQMRGAPPAGGARPAPPARPGLDTVLDLHDLLAFPAAVARAVRAHHVGFPARLTVRRHRRWLQVIGPRLVAEPQSESCYSCTLEAEWGRHGALLPRLHAPAAAEGAAAVVALFRARHALPPAPYHGVAGDRRPGGGRHP